MQAEMTASEAATVPPMGDPEARHLRQCLREAGVVLILWLAGLAWTLVVVIGWGYVPVDERPELPVLVLGMPAWVVWGLFVPWFLEIAAAWWFALRVLADDDPDQQLDADGEVASAAAPTSAVEAGA